MNGKFTVEQRDILSMLSSMQPICSKRTTLDITETILFQVAPKELTLKSTDLEISLQSTLNIESDLLENISFLISGKRIFELVKEMEGQIEFEVDENQLKLTSENVVLALNIKEAEEFPPFPERIENLMEIDSKFLLSLLNKVAFLVPQNNSNIALNGMLLEFKDKQMSFVATDGHCLAKVKTDKYNLPEDKKWLLPKRAVLEIKKILESSDDENTFLGTCGNQLVFSGSNFNFFTKLISESFPQYDTIMVKKGFIPATLSRELFVKTLKRTSCLLAGQFVSTNFKFKPGIIDVSLHNKEVGKIDESLPLKGFEGKDIDSRFYSPYLLNGLQVFPEENVKFFVKNDAKPIIFEAESDSYHLTYLVMPISATES